MRQPTAPSVSAGAPSDFREPVAVIISPLQELHLKSILDFANPRGFGLVEDRKKVAGFQPHQFRAVPQAKQWKVQSVELVSLLMHAGPVVYVSAELPRMDKLGKVPTRPLNTFEAMGLESLQHGEELFVRQTDDGLRMMGALRSITQCVNCHGGERGDLLGAFSYNLARSSDK